jgi:hypothetical protein
MRRELTAAELQPMTGHASVEMVDYYNRKVLDMVLSALPQKGKAAADTLFVLGTIPYPPIPQSPHI